MKLTSSIDGTPAIVATTCASPAACAGVIAVICVKESTVKSAAGVPPKLNSDTYDRFIPLMVTVSPPSVDPVLGLTDDTTGAET